MWLPFWCRNKPDGSTVKLLVRMVGLLEGGVFRQTVGARSFLDAALSMGVLHDGETLEGALGGSRLRRNDLHQAAASPSAMSQKLVH